MQMLDNKLKCNTVTLNEGRLMWLEKCAKCKRCSTTPDHLHFSKKTEYVAICGV